MLSLAQPITIHEGKGFNMTYEISTECIACGACEAECPEKAISPKGDVYYIDPALCKDCGTCEEVCPVGAPHKL
jgi:ferredoxin